MKKVIDYDVLKTQVRSSMKPVASMSVVQSTVENFHQLFLPQVR